MAVIPPVGPPFEGDYTGQFVIFTDPAPRDDVSPAVIDECDVMDWSPEQTRGYQVLIIDQLSDDPEGVTVDAFTNQNEPRIDIGNAFVINRTIPCPGGYLKLELEQVPIETFNPRYGADDDAPVGDSPGPTVTPTGEPETTETPGQTGFGASVGRRSLPGPAPVRCVSGARSPADSRRD